VAQEAGIRYRWSVPGKRPLNILQTIGNGCAFLDFNQDGNLDILLIGKTLALYQGNGNGNFRDVTIATGLNRPQGDFRGCAVGDIDNDGYDDLYLSAYRGGILLKNQQGKQFVDITPSSGLRTQPWGSACAFGDIDNDGLLDLYVGNYVDFGPDSIQLCKINGVLTACSPQTYDAVKGVLYHNRGNGKFQDVTTLWGADKVSGKALGVAFADYDHSGKQSITIANDEIAGDLLQNKGTRFENVGQLAGTAYSRVGKPHAGMGTDWGDFNNDGLLDLVVTTFALEAKAIYINEGESLFTESSSLLGVALPAMPYVAFGVKWLDFDNDGWLDLVVANGHTSDNIAEYQKEQMYRQPTLLFRNQEGRSFVEVSKISGKAFQKPIVGRGLATGDYDNDGRIDILIVDSEGAPLLLHNETQPIGNYLSLQLRGTKSNRNGYGAKVTIEAGGVKRYFHCHSDGSFFSASDSRIHCGLGTARSATVTVLWTTGKTEQYPNLSVNSRYLLTEGVAQTKKLP
jgi:hypothetical protein